MYPTRGDFNPLITAFNDVSTGTHRGVEAFCKLLEIQSQLRHTHNLDPSQESAYRAINTTQAKFKSLLCAKYFLAAQQLYEGATDTHFANSGRKAFEVLSDLHYVPVYMEMGKEAVGKKGALVKENWGKIGIAKEDYDSVVKARLADEGKRIWAMITNRQESYDSFSNAVHEIGLLLKRAGLSASDEATYQKLGTTKAAFDAHLAEKQEAEQARRLPHNKIPRASL